MEYEPLTRETAPQSKSSRTTLWWAAVLVPIASLFFAVASTQHPMATPVIFVGLAIQAYFMYLSVKWMWEERISRGFGVGILLWLMIISPSWAWFIIQIYTGAF